MSHESARRPRPRHVGPLDGPKLLEIIAERPEGWSRSLLTDRVGPGPKVYPILEALMAEGLVEQVKMRRTRYGRPGLILRVASHRPHEPTGFGNGPTGSWHGCLTAGTTDE